MPNSRVTSFECQYNLINYDARQDATISSTDVKSFCNVEQLVADPVNYSYMTMEHNYSVLDGSLEEVPDSFTTPYFSEELSDENGEFTQNPCINISFTTPQDFIGFTFNFIENYPLELSIDWVDTSNNHHISTHYPDSLTYVAEIEALEAMSVSIEFVKTVPYRYIKLVGILFGQRFRWTEEEIKEADLLLENDILSDKVSTNELTFKIVDTLDDYNLANSSGLHIYFQKRQEIDAYEWVNGTRLNLGTYFLDNFSVENNLVNIKCVSYMGLLDTIQYNNGDIYNGELAGNILEDIFEVAGIEDYLIDTVTYNTPVYGTLKPMTCRAALREVLFACSSIVDTTSESGIVVSKSNNIIGDTITRGQKVSTKITKNDYVYGVEIEYAEYSLSAETEDIVKQQEYVAGEYTIVFNDAYNNVKIYDDQNNEITPTELNPYYCSFELLADTVVSIRGNKYQENVLTTRVTNKYLQSGENANISKYSSRLCNNQMARNKAYEILDYLQYRLTINIQAISSDISLDGRRWVENVSRKYANFITWYVSRNLDLTGGFVDTAKLVGYYYIDYNYYFAGQEIYTGENLGII